jgi:hypothetical protein
MIRALAIALCLLASPASALELVYDVGTFTPAQTTFTAADQPVTIRCAGPTQTTLLLPAGGFEFTYDSEFAAPSVDGCTLATDQAGGGTAITVTGPVLPTASQHGPKLRNLVIRGENVQQDYWNKGIRFIDVWNPILRDIIVKGKDQPVPNFLMLTCVEFERSQVVDIEKLDCYHVQTAVKQLGGTFGEGFSLRDFNLVGVNRGIELLQGSGYVIGDGHMNAAERCIYAEGKTQLSVTNIICYKTHLSTRDFVGFEFYNSQQLHVANNFIQGSVAPTESGRTSGMVLRHTFNSQFIGNTCDLFKLTYGCIIVGTNTRENQFVANQSRNGAGTVVVINPGSGVNNLLSLNAP